MTEFEDLPPCSPSPSQRHADTRRRFLRPPILRPWRHEFEAHLHAFRFLGLGAHVVQQLCCKLILRRELEYQRIVAEVGVLPLEMVVLPFEVQAHLLEVGEIESLRKLLTGLTPVKGVATALFPGAA